MKKVKLGEVCEIRIGKTPNRSQTLYWGGDYPWLSISDMKGKILCTTKEKITQEAVQKEKMQIVSKGTVVMSFKLSIGKVGILAENMYTNEAIANFVVKNNKMLFNEYLYYALQGINFDSLTDRAVMGKTLNKAKLNNLSIVYNEPFMQQQIVLRLDGVNKLIESRKQQLSELSKLVKSRFNEMFEDYPDSVFLDTYIKELRAGKSLAGEENNKNKVLKTGAVSYDYFNSSEVKNLPIDYIPLDEHKVEIGDVIISRMNTSELVGAAGYVWAINSDNIYLPDRLWKVILNDRVNPVFLWKLITNEKTKLKIKRISSGTSGSMKNISKSKFLQIRVPLPPLSLQNEFADFVAQVDKSQFTCQMAIKLWRNSLKSSII